MKFTSGLAQGHSTSYNLREAKVLPQAIKKLWRVAQCRAHVVSFS